MKQKRYTEAQEFELKEAPQRRPTRLTRKAWGEFIARWTWEWFVTLTFKDDTHPERALKLFRVWCSKLSQELHGRGYNQKQPFGVTWVVAVEFQKSGRVHLHALLLGVWDTRRLEWMDRWVALDKLAGHPRIWPVTNHDAVSNYVTKYVAKGGDVEFSRNLRIRSRDWFDQPSESESETWRTLLGIGKCKRQGAEAHRRCLTG